MRIDWTRSSQGKLKLHFTLDRSLRRSTRSHEAHRLCGTSWSQPPLRRAFGCRRAYRRRCSPAVVEVPLAGVLLAAILRLGLRVNLFPRAPRGLYRAVT